jgi:hypothetical protein
MDRAELGSAPRGSRPPSFHRGAAGRSLRESQEAGPQELGQFQQLRSVALLIHRGTSVTVRADSLRGRDSLGPVHAFDDRSTVDTGAGAATRMRPTVRHSTQRR